MYKFIVTATLIISFFISSSTIMSKEWYAGGNLHTATVSEWNNASNTNKIATASDWVASSAKGKQVFKQTGDIDSLKPYVHALLNCVNEAAAGEGYENMKIAEIAASCIIMMGYSD